MRNRVRVGVGDVIMQKTWFITTETLALAGAMAGLGAFGGMAFASTPPPTTAPVAIVQSAATTPNAHDKRSRAP
ncbi:MAG: hypothetical protein P4L59_03690 [Desulfosporosinus sp.]|nr:hypothetical protein [Desulfosporosinus sp.]